MKRFALLAIVLLTLMAPLASAFEVGEKIALIKRTEMKTLSEASTTFTPGSTLKILAVDGLRLKVVAGRIGWIDANSAISAKLADAHFSALINTDPKDKDALVAR